MATATKDQNFENMRFDPFSFDNPFLFNAKDPDENVKRVNTQLFTMTKSTCATFNAADSLLFFILLIKNLNIIYYFPNGFYTSF